MNTKNMVSWKIIGLVGVLFLMILATPQMVVGELGEIPQDVSIKFFVKDNIQIESPVVGDVVKIVINVQNTGSVPKTVNISLLDNTNTLVSYPNETIQPNSFKEYTFGWSNTTFGKHDISVEVNGVSALAKGVDVKNLKKESSYVIIVPIASFVGLAFAACLAYYVLKQDTGTKKMQEISNAIKEGAEAFLKTQYTTITILAVIIAGIMAAAIGIGTNDMMSGAKTAGAFLIGAGCSALAGYLGMHIAIRTNIRTASATQVSIDKALKVAIRGGAVSGITIVAMSLLGVISLFYLYGYGQDPRATPLLIVGFGFGASFVALFAQLGGGIFTKAADVGADLVGKVEAGIPEDDPRNPAVIADLVGDNVGDCAGRGADLFESTAAENIGAMILGIALYPAFGINGIMFPLVARAFGIFATIIGLLFVRMKTEDEHPMKALNKGYYVTSIFAAVFFYIVTMEMLGSIWFFYAGMVGIITSIAFVYITQYYTESRFRPVKEIAKACQTGPATNIITGFSMALECTAVPIIVLSAALWLSFKFGTIGAAELSIGEIQGGYYGTGIATMGMLATCAYILAMDTFGPIVDNAGGILEMSDVPEELRKKTDKLDAVGNTTKALTKGYAVGSAALAAFLLFSAYMEASHLTSIRIDRIEVFIGGMIGAMLVFLFSALAIRAVGRAAYYIINEVRRQFKEKPGIMAGTDKPDYGTCVAICTRGALKEMVLPGILAVATPIAVGLVLRAEALGATLMIGTIVGVILALVFNNGGGAWDNAKKFIEAGNYGGKRSETHKAAVVGDTVGDPFKDTAGPSLHVLIKLLGTLTLVFAALFI
ncbi:MAG: sodium-translocating pyrophosphatase [Thermoplasmata archaeon]